MTTNPAVTGVKADTTGAARHAVAGVLVCQPASDRVPGCTPARSMRETPESDTISLWNPACGVLMTDMSASDFAVVVYREDDVWEVDVLPAALTENLDGLILAMRQQPSIGGAIGLAAVGDDFFVALRVVGNQVSVFLSDVTASVDWPLARQVLDYLDIPVPEDEDLDQVLPAGDMSIFADLGVDEMDLGALSGNLDLFPDEVLASIARRLGFGPALERALDSALGA
jgi:putative tRNA adenosine deaminase-associated protein